MREQVEKIVEIIQKDIVGKSAIDNWFPNGYSLEQFDEIAYNRFYRLAQAICDAITLDEERIAYHILKQDDVASIAKAIASDKSVIQLKGER